MKKLKISCCVLLIGLLSVSVLSAQKEGKFVLIVLTPDAYIKLDSQKMEKIPIERRKTLLLTEGVHTFQIWAAGHELTKDTVYIIANDTSQRVYNLKRTEAFVKYRNELGNSALDNALLVGGKIGIVAANIGVTWFVAVQGRAASNKKLDLLKLNQHNFESSGSLANLPTLKSDFDASKKDYENSVKSYNTKLMIGIPLTLAAYYGSYRLIKRMNKTKQTQADFKDKNPLSKVEYRIDPIYESAFKGSLGMNLNIKF